MLIQLEGTVLIVIVVATQQWLAFILIAFILLTEYIGGAIMDDNDSLHSQLQRSQSTITIEEVRSKTSSSNIHSQLTQRDEKMYQKIQELNIKGTIQSRSDNHSQALAYFSQCEKILQYAASCGSSIDCSYILTILHNQAATYQALNEIEKASSYIQAIIYNLVMFLERSQHVQVINRLEELATKDGEEVEGVEFLRQNYQIIKVYLGRKYELGVYYLQFSGLNSQSQMHNQSIKNARKALQTLKELCLLCFHYECIQTSTNTYDNLWLKQLSDIKQEFKDHEVTILRQQLKKISAALNDNSQDYHQYYQHLSYEKKIEIQTTNINSLFQLKPMNILESVLLQSSQIKNYNIDLCSSYFMHLKVVLALMGSYFAIGVELEEIYGLNTEDSSFDSSWSHRREKKTKKVQAEMILLAGLILGYKYIPVQTELCEYMQHLYDDNYKKSQAIKESILEMRDLPTSEPYELPQTKIDESLVRGYSQFETNSNGNESAMKMSINLLTQKYKNYLVDRDIDLGDNSQSVSLCVPKPTQPKQIVPKQQQKEMLWSQEKKESKKLAQLLKNEAPGPATNLLKPSYLNEVASIDSISMANSHSAQQSMPQMKKEDAIDIRTGQRKMKIQNLKVSKQIPECSSDIQENMAQQDKKYTQCTDKLKPFHLIKQKKVDSQSFRKSKSTKVLKSKSKEVIKDHRIVFTQRTIPSVHEVTSTDKSNTRIKPKKSHSKNKYSTHQTELMKLIVSQKRLVDQSGAQKVSKGFNSTRSIKDNLNSIKFHRVKSPQILPTRPDNIQAKQPKITYTRHLQMLASTKDKATKSKSKNKSTSLGSKKQSSKQKSISQKKNLAKTVKASQPTIYTSGSTNIKRR